MAIERFDDLIEMLQTHPEWRQQLRQLVLTDELIGLPDLVAELVGAQRQSQQQLSALTERMGQLVVRMDQLVVRMDQLAEAQATTEARLQGLAAQLSRVADRTDAAYGYIVELRYRQRAHAYFQRIARRIHVLSGEELDDLLEPAIEQGVLAEQEAGQVHLADAVLRGRLREDDEPVLLVLEVSVLVDAMDVQRAADCAGVLARLGTRAVGVVAGEQIMPMAALQAQKQAVWQVTDGRAEPPPSAA